ncbi:unnamed protein product [Symbiodinium pilosum]|uniref:Uncharacterized protein n=1 Tax=Symbiodinium pilosum TaxID=2952 RepID=A0A812S815_SYMPI|nr:unnamed protein product [Symbiodinium pilosum]
MVIWTEGLYDLSEAYDWVEYFAGTANATRAARLRGAAGGKANDFVAWYGGSLAEYHPVWRSLLVHLYQIGGVGAVSRVGWYVGAFFAKSLKRQYAYSNSPAIRALDRSHLQGIYRGRLCQAAKVKTANVYFDKKGKKRFIGTSQLKNTETLAFFGFYAVRVSGVLRK